MKSFQAALRIEKHKKAVLAGLAVLMILAAVPLYFAGYTNDVRNLFPRNSDTSRAFDVMQRAHLADAVQLELISPQDKRISDCTGSIELAAEKISAIPGVAGVSYRMGKNSGGFKLSDITLFLPQLTTPDILDDCDSRAAVRNALRQLAFPVPGALENASSSPFGKELAELKKLGKLNDLLGMKFAPGEEFFFDRTLRRALITFDAAIPVGDADSVRKLYSEIEKIVSGLPDPLEYRLISGCSHTLGNEETLKRDASVSGVLSVVFLALLFCVFYRRDVRALWIPVIPLAASLFSLAAMSFVFKEICLYVVGLGSCVTGLAVDQGIHVYAACKEDDPESSLRQIIQPLACSAGTSITVFSLLAFTGIEAYVQFAFFAGVSLFLSCLLAVFILPLLLKKGKKEEVGKIPEIPERFSLRCRIFTLLLFAGAAVSLNWVQSDFSLMSLDGTPDRIIRQEQEFRRVWRDDQAGCGIFACIGRDREDALRKYEKYASKLPREVLFTTPVRSEAFRRGNLEKWRTPETLAKLDALEKELDVQAVKSGLPSGFFKSFFRRLSEGITGENIPVPAVFHMVDSRMIKENRDGCAVISLFADTPENILLLKNISRGSGDAAVLSGNAFSEMVKDDLLKKFHTVIPAGCLLAVVFVVLALRNWRDVLAALIPVVSAFAVLALFFATAQVKVTPASAFALVLLSGLAVDYGIYAGHLGRNPQAKQIRGAVLLSAATTVLGSGALLFSSHPALNGSGIVLALGIAAAAASGIWIVPFFYRTGKCGKAALKIVIFASLAGLSGCITGQENSVPDYQVSGQGVCTSGEESLSFMLMAKSDSGKLSVAAVSSSGMLIFRSGSDGKLICGPGVPASFSRRSEILRQDIRKIFLTYPAAKLADNGAGEYILDGGSVLTSKWKLLFSGNGKNIVFERWGIFTPSYRLDVKLR